jgi:hypothetical protein
LQLSQPSQPVNYSDTDLSGFIWKEGGESKCQIGLTEQNLPPAAKLFHANEAKMATQYAFFCLLSYTNKPGASRTKNCMRSGTPVIE